MGHSHAEIMEGGDINKCPYYAAKMGKTLTEGFRSETSRHSRHYLYYRKKEEENVAF